MLVIIQHSNPHVVHYIEDAMSHDPLNISKNQIPDRRGFASIGDVRLIIDGELEPCGPVIKIMWCYDKTSMWDLRMVSLNSFAERCL